LLLPACPQILDGEFETRSIDTGGAGGAGGGAGASLGGGGSTPEPVDSLLRDDFETYTSDGALRAAYAPVSGSGSIEASLDSTRGDNEGNAMRVEFTLGSTGYVGLGRPMLESWTGAIALSVWIAPDTNGRELVLQFREASGEYWERRVTLDTGAPTRLDLPLAGFTIPSWSEPGNALQELQAIVQVALFFDGPPANEAILWIDDLRVLMR
jgi:mannan endo-1,4-beta-mannosidase